MPELEVVIITPEQPLNMDYECFLLFFSLLQLELKFQVPASRARLLFHIECEDQASEFLGHGFTIIMSNINESCH